jgi:hypothetical protein
MRRSDVPERRIYAAAKNFVVRPYPFSRGGKERPSIVDIVYVAASFFRSEACAAIAGWLPSRFFSI